MYKVAQKRSLSDLFREWTNFGARKIENEVDIFRDMMDRLREHDNEVRATLLGKTVGVAMPFGGDVSADELLRSAKKNLDNLEYLQVISDLDQLYSKIAYTCQTFKKIEKDLTVLNKAYLQFLAGNITPEQAEQVSNYLNSKKATASDHNFVKTAAFFDFISHIFNSGFFNDRKSALELWSSINPAAAKELRAVLTQAYSITNNILNTIKNNLV